MKKPSLQDFNLIKFKIEKGGAGYVEWNYQYSVGNEAHTDYPKVKRTMSVHNDLYSILKKQRPNVLVIEAVNYRLAVTTSQKRGVDEKSLKELSLIAEGMTQEAISNIEVTGFKISGSGEKRKVNITYKKRLSNKEIEGRSTGNILLAGNDLGFEQELETDIEEFIKEVYEYIYKDKHSDSDQLELDMFENETEEIEE